MNEQRTGEDRVELLADVAEMYFLEGLTQAEIAKRIGVTRSMISRMLTDARQQGIVDIQIHRPLSFDRELNRLLCDSLGLKEAFVIQQAGDNLLERLGTAGAYALNQYIRSDSVLGLAWGTAISAVINAISFPRPMPLKIVQLVAALGARIQDYDGHALVQRLVDKSGGEGYYLNAPYMVGDVETVRSLLENRSLSETVTMSKRCDVALLGIGSTDPNYSSFFLAGYVSKEELYALINAGSVGDVCALHFDRLGKPTAQDFVNRTVTISSNDLFNIPVRIGVAGGLGKVSAILGATRGGYVNVLVTDSLTAREVLALKAI